MKNLLKGTLVIAAFVMTSICTASCSKDDGKDFDGFTVVQKSDPVDFELTIAGGDKVDTLLVDNQPAEQVAAIICHDNYANPFGHAVVKYNGSYRVVYWHTDPSKLPAGFSVTQYTSAFGGTRYMVSCPISEGDVSTICG